MIPIEGPFNGAQEITRREVRLTVPIGIGIHVDERFWLLFGATPWWVLNRQPATWDASGGVIFSVGFEIR